MRLIDADELKRSFNKLCDRFGEDFHISAIETEIDAAQTVDAADVMRGMWISVKDRLPDSNGLYIVTACDEGCSAGEGIWYDTVVVTAEYYDGIWTWFEGGSEYDLSGIVTHWMPLPEPPEEDKP